MGIFFTSYRIVNEKALIIENVDQNKNIVINVPDRNFCISFIHSIQKTPVYEYFYITNDNKLLLNKTKYYSLGVGLPFSEENGSFSNDNGEFVLKLSREFDTIPLRVSPLPDHVIIVEEKVYPLVDFSDPEDLLNIRATNQWTIKNIKRKERENG